MPHRFVNVLVYYGLWLGVSRLGTDLHLTQVIFRLVEIPARTLVLSVLPYSRRLCQSGFLAAGGLSYLLILAVPAGSQASFIDARSKESQNRSCHLTVGDQQPMHPTPRKEALAERKKGNHERLERAGHTTHGNNT